jgi:hypothetical protein
VLGRKVGCGTGARGEESDVAQAHESCGQNSSIFSRASSTPSGSDASMSSNAPCLKGGGGGGAALQSKITSSSFHLSVFRLMIRLSSASDSGQNSSMKWKTHARMAWSSDSEPRPRSPQMFCAAVLTSWLALSKSCCMDGSTTSKESPTMALYLALSSSGLSPSKRFLYPLTISSSARQMDLTWQARKGHARQCRGVGGRSDA